MKQPEKWALEVAQNILQVIVHEPNADKGVRTIAAMLEVVAKLAELEGLVRASRVVEGVQNAYRQTGEGGQATGAPGGRDVDVKDLASTIAAIWSRQGARGDH